MSNFRDAAIAIAACSVAPWACLAYNAARSFTAVAPPEMTERRPAPEGKEPTAARVSRGLLAAPAEAHDGSTETGEDRSVGGEKTGLEPRERQCAARCGVRCAVRLIVVVVVGLGDLAGFDRGRRLVALRAHRRQRGLVRSVAAQRRGRGVCCRRAVAT